MQSSPLVRVFDARTAREVEALIALKRILVLTMTKRRSSSGSAPSRPVTRQEFEGIVSTLDDCCTKLDLQFKRIAQIQAELDHIRGAWRTASTLERRKATRVEPT